MSTLVLAAEDREGPNTQDRTEHLMAETGQHIEDTIPPIIHLVLRAVLMTVRDDDTPWHPQFFSPVTFESQRLTEDTRCHG